LQKWARDGSVNRAAGVAGTNVTGGRGRNKLGVVERVIGGTSGYTDVPRCPRHAEA